MGVNIQDRLMEVQLFISINCGPGPLAIGQIQLLGVIQSVKSPVSDSHRGYQAVTGPVTRRPLRVTLPIKSINLIGMNRCELPA